MKENVLYFTKIKIEHTSGSIVWNFIQFAFLVCQVRTKLKLQTIFFYLKLFEETKTGLELVTLHDF